MLRLARPLALALAFLITVVTTAARADTSASDPPDESEVLYGCGKPKGKFSISLKPDVELDDLVTWAMGFSCKKFLYSSSLTSRSSKVTVITPGTMTPSEAWGVFGAALHSMGLTVVTKGAVLEIVESAKAKDEALAILREFPDKGVEVVRMLLRPEYVAVDELRAALELVRSQHGAIAALPGSRAILVTDDASHVARMKTLVDELDQPSPGDAIYAIPLEHVDAAQVVETVTALLASGGAAGAGKGAAAEAPAARLVADDRLNAVFLAGTASEYLRVRAVIQAIDVDAGDATQVHLIRLRYAQAADVVQTLQPLLADTGGAARKGDTSGGFSPSGQIVVAAEAASNALLVRASGRDAASLRDLVEQLDVPRRQVYIEALVLEVESSKVREVGASWHLGSVDSSGNTSIGGYQTAGLSSVKPETALTSVGLSGGGLAGILGSALENTVLGQTIPSIGLLVKATSHSSRLDILASPHIMTIDNQKAIISVGSNIPYKSSDASTTATGLPVTANIERQKIALTLEITPHVSAASEDDPGAGDVVRLDIKLESSQLGQEDYGDNLGPTWKERMIETSVVLRDQESLVLGGLVDERIEDVVDGLPILMDLPVIGALFRSTKKVRLKSNLLVILTPHLIEDTIAGRELLARRMGERDEFLDAAADLERRVLQPQVDYRKKRGVIAEIDAVVESIERDRAERERNQPPARPSGQIDAPPPPLAP